MKISLITSTYNSAATLPDTLASVRSQNFDNLEYILVDGQSKDGTTDLIKSNLDVIDQWVSEPDQGIYDAINKGIAMASGDVVGILHSDDLFASSDVLSNVAAKFSDPSVDAVYGDLQYVDRNNTNKVIRDWTSQPYDHERFLRGWMPAHPTFYLRRAHFETYGAYRMDFFTAADYELMLRMLYRHALTAVYLPQVMVKMRVGGQSNVSWKNRWIANQEDARAWKVNELRPKWYTRWLKPLSKLGQFFG